jgi:hypothetical protein
VASAPVRSLALSSLVLLGCACSAIRSVEDPEPQPQPQPPTPPPVMVAGSWAGAWEIEGRRLEGTLLVRQEGTDLRATFTSRALGGEAVGSGKLDDRRVQLDLSYNVACPGTARLSGDVLGEGALLDGALTASDCTGRATGTFSFARR